VPEEITFKTKPGIALERMRAACAAGVPLGVVPMDASYGSNSDLRYGVSQLALLFVAGIVPTLKVRAVTEGGEPTESLSPRLGVKELALSLPKGAWRTVAWREGTNARLSSRFARVRVRTSPIRRAGGEDAADTVVTHDGEDRGTRTINEAEANIVRRIFAEYIDGRSPLAIVKELNREAVPAPRGGSWSASTLNGSRHRQKIASSQIHSASGGLPTIASTLSRTLPTSAGRRAGTTAASG
jgi:hypothetical protein